MTKDHVNHPQKQTQKSEQGMFKKSDLSVLLIAAATLVGCKNMDTIYVQPVANLNTEFAMGADISTLLEVERGGGKFYNEQGKKVDAIEFLNNKGVNWVRLRLWNDPYYVSWQETHWEWVDDNNTPYYPTNPVNGAVGAGTNDLAATITLAKRAKEAGMKVLLDFHYSDFWADPG